MHIPDGLMAPAVSALGWVVAVAVLYVSLRKVRGRIEEKDIPLMAVLGAGIFVAQMLNFPIGGGTTGHLVGAALAAVLLGPYAAVLVITSILIIQCFMFGDGGITALGLNITNMAVVGSFTGGLIYRYLGSRNRGAAVFVGSWLAVFLGAILCSIELAVSYGISGGAYGIPGGIAIPAMAGYHALIGIGEGIIATGVVSFISQAAPEIMNIGRKEAVPDA